MSWRTAPERTISTAAAELATTLGEPLRSLVVYGSAARDDFDPRHSTVNLAVVAAPLGFTQVGQVAQWLTQWRAEGFAAPLLLSTTDLARSLDVFPLEFLDIQAYHRVLAGADLFTGLDLPADAVRRECEREAKGKLVRLRELYLELAGSGRELRALMLDSRKSFLMVMRGLLHIRGEGWAGSPHDVVERFERSYDCTMPALAALDPTLIDQPIEQHFDDYLQDVELLATIADRALHAPQ